jgi:hypothetical protein
MAGERVPSAQEAAVRKRVCAVEVCAGAQDVASAGAGDLHYVMSPIWQQSCLLYGNSHVSYMVICIMFLKMLLASETVISSK